MSLFRHPRWEEGRTTVVEPEGHFVGGIVVVPHREKERTHTCWLLLGLSRFGVTGAMSNGDEKVDIATQLINELPKVELHLHIEGTLEPEFVFELAKKYSVTLPYDSVADLRSKYDTFTKLDDFLDLYYNGCNVLREEIDFYDLTYQYLTKISQQNVVHVDNVAIQ